MMLRRIVGLIAVVVAFTLQAGAAAGRAVDRWTNTVHFEHGLFSTAHYDAAERTLTLVFWDDAAYRYHDVHADDYADFLKAEDKARFFHAHIRKFHRYERLDRYVASACRSRE